VTLLLKDPVVVATLGEDNLLLAERTDLEEGELNGQAQTYRHGQFIEPTAPLQSFYKFNGYWEELDEPAELEEYGIDGDKDNE